VKAFTGCAVVLCGLHLQPVLAQSAPPCTAPEHAQFDFWVGDWEVRWTDPEKGEQRGRNRVRRTLDGCVILEQFDGRPGTPLQGISVSTLDSKSKQWKQVWVDNSGNHLDFEGGFAEGRMTLLRAPAGSGSLQRMVFSEIKPDSLTWDWQLSKDGGATWATQWRILYTRRKSPEPGADRNRFNRP
jgi:hypothetical protein